jgi:hypothetical protein
MSNEKDHFLAKRIQEFQRQNSKGFVCHLCEDGPYFSSETKLFDHARAQHQDAAGSSKHDGAWKAFIADASSTAYVNSYPSADGPAAEPRWLLEMASRLTRRVSQLARSLKTSEYRGDC